MRNTVVSWGLSFREDLTQVRTPNSDLLRHVIEVQYSTSRLRNQQTAHWVDSSMDCASSAVDVCMNVSSIVSLCIEADVNCSKLVFVSLQNYP